MTRAYVKGGMPVDVEGYTESGGSSAYGSDEPPWLEVHITGIYWPDSARPVTKAFEESLSPSDWEAMEDAIAESEW